MKFWRISLVLIILVLLFVPIYPVQYWTVSSGRKPNLICYKIGSKYYFKRLISDEEKLDDQWQIYEGPQKLPVVKVIFIILSDQVIYKGMETTSPQPPQNRPHPGQEGHEED